MHVDGIYCCEVRPQPPVPGLTTLLNPICPRHVDNGRQDSLQYFWEGANIVARLDFGGSLDSFPAHLLG